MPSAPIPKHKRRSRAKIAFKVSFTTAQQEILKMHQLLHIFHVYVPRLACDRITFRFYVKCFKRRQKRIALFSGREKRGKGMLSGI